MESKGTHDGARRKYTTLPKAQRRSVSRSHLLPDKIKLVLSCSFAEDVKIQVLLAPSLLWLHVPGPWGLQGSGDNEGQVPDPGCDLLLLFNHEVVSNSL